MKMPWNEALKKQVRAYVYFAFYNCILFKSCQKSGTKSANQDVLVHLSSWQHSCIFKWVVFFQPSVDTSFARLKYDVFNFERVLSSNSPFCPCVEKPFVFMLMCVHKLLLHNNYLELSHHLTLKIFHIRLCLMFLITHQLFGHLPSSQRWIFTDKCPDAEHLSH